MEYHITLTEPIIFSYQLVQRDNDSLLEHKLINFVCAESYTNKKDLFHMVKKRDRNLVEARQIIMAFRTLALNMPTCIAGSLFLKDHATVLHAIDTVKNLYLTDRQYKSKYLKTFGYILSVCPDFFKLTARDSYNTRYETYRRKLRNLR